MLKQTNSKFKIFLLVLCNTIALLLLGFLSLDRKDFFQEHFEVFSINKQLVILISFCLLFFSYLIISRINVNKKIIYSYLFFIFFLTLLPPFLSRDILSYLIPAKNLLEGINPYQILIGGNLENLWNSALNNIWWGNSGYTYGPVFLLFSVLSVIGVSKLMTAVILYKILNLIIFVATILIFKKILLLKKIDQKVAYLFALNPLVIVHFVLEAHNDLLLLLFVLVFYYFILVKDLVKSIAFFTLAFWVKYYSLVFFPLIFLRKFTLKKALISLGVFAILSGLILSVFDFPLREILNSLVFQSKLPCIYSCPLPISLAYLINPTWQKEVIYIALFFACLVIFYLFFIRKKEPEKFVYWSLFFLLFSRSWVTPWSITILVPFGLLFSDDISQLLKSKYWVITNIITVYGLIHYFGF